MLDCACPYLEKTRMIRFFSKIKKTNNCWLWIASKRQGKRAMGYGQFETGYAHRASWEIHNGKIPSGMLILHKCDNPPCVNPDHLFLGTYQDNENDKKIKSRQARGCAIGSSKYNEIDILGVKLLLALKHNQSKLSRLLGISQSHISRISKNETWSHLN